MVIFHVLFSHFFVQNLTSTAVMVFTMRVNKHILSLGCLA